MFKTGGRMDLVERETAQLLLLQAYLPEQMGEEGIRRNLNELVTRNSGADFPALIKLAMGELKGKADGAVVSRLLRDIMLHSSSI
jgi:uncharacterized protein YqeY